MAMAMAMGILHREKPWCPEIMPLVNKSMSEFEVFRNSF